jgi:hypothetical protein
MDLMHGHDLEGFIDFSETELAIIREALHQEAQAWDTARADDRLIEAEEDDSEKDDTTNDEPSESGLLPSIAELCLGGRRTEIVEA